MGFINDKFREEIEQERRTNQQTQDHLTRQAIDSFCSDNNLSYLAEKVKASVLDQLRNTQRTQIESTDVSDKPGMTYKLIHENVVCTNALKKFIKDIEPATSDVKIIYDNGNGDYEPQGRIIVSFDPPLSL